MFSQPLQETDRTLAELNSGLPMLVLLTPLNVEEAWHQFKKDRYSSAPHYEYRPPGASLGTFQARLDKLPIQQIETPELQELMSSECQQLHDKILLIQHRNTTKAVEYGRQLYGDIEESLHTQAEQLLKQLTPRSHGEAPTVTISAKHFVRKARKEVEYYRQRWSDFPCTVEEREDIAGILVSDGHLLISKDAHPPVSRIEALLHHEIGTHGLTHANGSLQPLISLSKGLARYEILQEGLAVLSEYLCGGLMRPRLRLLAGRVIAAESVLSGASWMDTFSLVHKEYGFSRRVSYDLTWRVHRGGGFCKDAIYLKGFAKLIERISEGINLSSLFIGRFGFEHIPLIQKLLEEQKLLPPKITPRYLEEDDAQKKLKELQKGLSLSKLASKIPAHPNRIDTHPIKQRHQTSKKGSIDPV